MMLKIFDYLQLALLGVFLCLFLGKTFYLRRKEKINAFLLSAGKDGLKNLIEISSFILTNIFTFTIIFYILTPAFKKFLSPLYAPVLDILPVKIFGLLVVATGFIFLIVAQVNLGNSWRLGIDTVHLGKLVTGGIYHISRHPIYFFFDLYFLGTFFLNANHIFLIYFILIVINLHFQALQEEKFLNDKFKAGYKKYSANTCMYLTFRKNRNR
jgi:protein-S-isoprenylcysteine O-methyltransferase Ste14